MFLRMRNICDTITRSGLHTDFIRYWHELILKIPDYIFQMLLSILCLGIAIFVVRKGIKKGF